jgi:hypothetical protein
MGTSLEYCDPTQYRVGLRITPIIVNLVMALIGVKLVHVGWRDETRQGLARTCLRSGRRSLFPFVAPIRNNIGYSRGTWILLDGKDAELEIATSIILRALNVYCIFKISWTVIRLLVGCLANYYVLLKLYKFKILTFIWTLSSLIYISVIEQIPFRGYNEVRYTLQFSKRWVWVVKILRLLITLLSESFQLSRWLWYRKRTIWISPNWTYVLHLWFGFQSAWASYQARSYPRLNCC